MDIMYETGQNACLIFLESCLQIIETQEIFVFCFGIFSFLVILEES